MNTKIFTIIAAFIFLLSFGLLNAQINLSNGLIRYYPLNGNALDASGNGVDATLDGATSAARYGISDQCYSTLADSGSNVTSPSLGNWGDNLVISLWFLPGVMDTNNAFSTICYSRNSNSTNYVNFSAVILHSDSLVKFGMGSFAGNGILYSSNRVMWGEWNHLIMIHDGLADSLKLVLNGVTTSMAWANTPKYKNTAIGFGNFNMQVNPTAGGLTGRVDEIRFYDRQLNQAEIDSLGNIEAFDMDLDYGLVAYYPFDNNVLDSTGNGNDGVPQNISFTDNL